MTQDKQDLVAALKRCAILMELAGENAFKCRAYEQGARIVESLEGEPRQWLETGRLNGVKGIGKGLLKAIEEWAASGRICELDELQEKIPPGLLDILHVPGIGPKKIKLLWETRGIDSLERLEQAARAGELNDLAGFGAKTVEKMLAGIEQRRQYAERHLIHTATAAAERILGHLRAVPGIGRLELAGSLRRRRETIKDIDLVATAADPAAVMQAFVTMPGVLRVVGHGATKSSILLAGGIPADLRVVAEDEFAAALNYFTGGKEHNTALRGRARRMGLKLNEYGLFREAPGDEPGERLPTPDEAAIYQRLGLAYIEPELREGEGEIEAAEAGELPRLVTADQVRGVLHCHTTYSDGRLGVLELAAACRDLGYEYLCICDHSQSAAYAGGLRVDAIRRQWDEIDAANAQLDGFRIFKGIESDILAEGELDYDDGLLARFDLVVASIHSRMTLDREAMTRRICRALAHPAVRILGHPTGRLLLRREPYGVDIDQVIETAVRHNVLLEINAHPHRLDLDWRLVRRAKARGARFAVNPDAHRREELGYIPYGVGIARKGWLEAEDVINMLPLKQFEQWLKR
ncbi:MAG TPA: DNA polymerase/3'-5' exonuclease PolX [Candidatus Sumerlaeota bacterium]|nr:DNA polymerase/3'-5' exonuclease PolX [Candidatus Sumerlaeota bacterium]HOR26814.1 DNA polymerase/3'-5' exonuclease PolX [Candidatus Sumerlaeota bacterium]HPK01444.1 DNA polymerase/3'-5' exonuclease PolX [Candidatus Sumerlaeota bacterium]